jgi:serine/threonine-protein kinase
MVRASILAGRYAVGPILGEGYYAKVFQLEELTTGALFAGKVYPARAAARAAALHEVAALTALAHPRMPSMREAFEVSGRTWVVMDLVTGPSLRDDVEANGPLEARAALNVGADVCELLIYVAAQGWTYRDLHPRNIHHLTPTGVIVLDFDGARPPHTAGEAGGRIGYRAPEVASSKRVHPGCHAFSVAGCIYFALVGADPPTAPGTLPSAEGLSVGAVEVLRRCRSADPEVRPTTRALRYALLDERRRIANG